MRASWLALAGICIAIPTLARGQVNGRGTPPTAKAVRAPRAPVMDGALGDSVWLSAPVITAFTQYEPFDGQPTTERTEVRVLYDRDAVYVGAWLFDSDAAGIVRGESRRDVDLSNADAFFIVFDTYLDRQNAFVFGTSPLGVEYDGQVTKEGEEAFGQSLTNRTQRSFAGGLNLNWDGNWRVVTSSDDRGWYAEFRIPYATLRYPRGGAQRWGLNFARHIRRKNEQAFWAPVPRQFDLFRVSLAGTLEGLEAPARRVASLTPYGITSVRKDYVRAVSGSDAEFGADAKIGITQSLTLDLTYNTDFAQVEVDDQQVNLTRFTLFFPEKRPFFLENAGDFSVGTAENVELFFSRGIGIDPSGRPVPILGGGRLTGKLGGMTLGLLNIATQDQDTLSGNNYSVIRTFKELPNKSRIGGILVSRVNTDDREDYNLTMGLDGRLGVGEKLLLDAYVARTVTPGLTGDDYAYNASASYTGRNWEWGAAYREVAEDFNPEVGFLAKGNTRFATLRVLHHIRTPGVPWFREFRPHITYREFFDFDWYSTTRLLHIDSHFVFANGAFFQLPALNFTREGLRAPFEISPGIIVPSGSYENAEWGFAYNTNLAAPVSVQGRVDIGGFYTGRRAGTMSTLNVRFGKVAGFVRMNYYDVRLPEGDFTTSIVGVKLAYSFTPRIYLQSLVQYNKDTDRIDGNYRFGWLNAAGTGLFIVLNDSEGTGSLSGPQERQLAVKFTKLLEVSR
ncbi:MAG TPA: DUF5916 domain-containing protein [Gemmatimonadaceae bacterium]|nr:DUF5916 domain-containing protein [Gemmatimonadaceae bacterium]